MISVVDLQNFGDYVVYTSGDGGVEISTEWIYLSIKISQDSLHSL